MVMKRVVDIVASLGGLVLLLPLFLIVAVTIKINSRGPVFFAQERIGKGFRPFWIYKFRTMVKDATQRGGALTASGDPRITRVGQILRNTKIDELPQLINVLRGDMSLVGPRPEVRRYVALRIWRHLSIGMNQRSSRDPKTLKRHMSVVSCPTSLYWERNMSGDLHLALISS